MNPNHEPWQPSAEQLSAYADGQLSAVDCRRVQEWLSSHPDVETEIEGFKHLGQLCRDTSPSEPSDAVWSALFDRIDREMTAARAALPPTLLKRAMSFAPFMAVSALTALAAACLLLIVSGRPGELPSLPVPTVPEQVEAWPVLSTGDVDIVSIDGSDMNCLVVGESPVRGTMMLVSPDEIVVRHTLPSSEGAVTTVRVQGTSNSSKVMATVDIAVQSAP